jgi:hypothetical protein
MPTALMHFKRGNKAERHHEKEPKNFPKEPFSFHFWKMEITCLLWSKRWHHGNVIGVNVPMTDIESVPDFTTTIHITPISPYQRHLTTRRDRYSLVTRKAWAQHSNLSEVYWVAAFLEFWRVSTTALSEDINNPICMELLLHETVLVFLKIRIWGVATSSILSQIRRIGL